MKTLQECIEEINKDCDEKKITLPIGPYLEAVAELYAQQFKDALENITKAHAHRGEVLEIEQQLLKEAREEKAKLIEENEKMKREILSI